MRKDSYEEDNLGNSFVTTTTPEVKAAIKAVAAKRIFLVFTFLSLVVVAFIVWELVDLLHLLQ